MSRAERDKGARGEREVAAIFRAAGFDCDRTPNSGALRIAGDLYGDALPLHVEAKNQRVLRIPLWLRQTLAEAPPDLFPLLAFRLDRRDHPGIGGWYGAMPLGDVISVFARASVALPTDSAHDAARGA